MKKVIGLIVFSFILFSSFSQTGETLQSVTDRGNITNQNVTVGQLFAYKSGDASTIAAGSPATGKTMIAISTSGDAGGYGIISTVQAQGLAYGNTVINPNGGNVGIGTTLPVYRLDVNGAGNFSGASLNENALTVLKSFVGGGDGYYTASIGGIDVGSGFTGIKIGKKGIGSLDGIDAIPLEVHGNGTPIATFTSIGNVGIGTSTPAYKLDVSGTGRFGGDAKIGSNIPEGFYQDVTNGAFRSGNGGDRGFYFQNYTGANTTMYVGLNGIYQGRIGIGTVNPQSELAVKGTITSKKVKVTQDGWADYVFDSSYQLTSLHQVEKYIQANKHLPEVPSAAEVKKDGLDLGDNQAVLLKKIEELTLYLIDQNKQIAQQNKDMQEMKKQISALQSKQ